MVDEKNHLFGPLDMLKDSKTVNKKKTQQQFSRFSISLATAVNNTSLVSNSPALQPNSKPQIGLPYDDTLGSISADVAISFQTFGSQYTFMEVTTDTAITFTDLPTGRFIEFTVDILVDQPSGVSLTFPQVTNPPVLSGTDGERSVLKFVGVRRSDPTGVNPPVDTYTFLSGEGGGGGSVTCPVICPEINLGDVSGGVQIDWSLSPFFRMKLVGDISVIMNNLPTAPGWHEITVEFLEDSVGLHEVVFLDVFRNSPLPIIRKGANRYTIVKFYSYFTTFDNILTWQPPFLDLDDGNGANSQANQGIIHVVLTADQLVNLAVNDHIEFDNILFVNNMTITSGGVGQANGIFAGFVSGRTYELTASLGVDRGAPPGGSISYQWFDIATSLLIGSQGTAQDPGQDNPYQTIAKAFFQPFEDTDSVELRIISQSGNPIDVVYSGVPIGLNPQSFAEIKDCGQTPEQFRATQEELINADAIVPPPPPLIAFSGRMMYYNFFQSDSYGRAQNPAVNGEINIPFMGRRTLISNNVSLSDDTAISRETMCVNVGTLKKLIIKWDSNSINKTYDVDLMRDDIKLTTLLTIPASTGGTFEWPSVGELGNIPLEFGHTYYYKFKTLDGLNPGGLMSGSIVTKIFWGGA